MVTFTVAVWELPGRGVVAEGSKFKHTLQYVLCSLSNIYLIVQFSFYLSFYPRDAMLARVIAIATCLSVRLSVTRRYCVKTKKASGMISSPSGGPKTLVF